MYGRDGVLMNNSQEMKQTSQKKSTPLQTSKYTEDWLPVKAIENGMIILDNKKLLSLLDVRFETFYGETINV